MQASLGLAGTPTMLDAYMDTEKRRCFSEHPTTDFVARVSGCSTFCSIASPCLFHRFQVLEAIALGRATLGKIQQNLAWALVYNLFGIPLAAGALLPFAGIILNPAVAGGMMAFRYVPGMVLLILKLVCALVMLLVA